MRVPSLRAFYVFFPGKKRGRGREEGLDEWLQRIDDREQHGLTVQALLWAVMSWLRREMPAQWRRSHSLAAHFVFLAFLLWASPFCMRVMPAHLSKCHRLCADPNTSRLAPERWAAEGAEGLDRRGSICSGSFKPVQTTLTSTSTTRDTVAGIV